MLMCFDQSKRNRQWVLNQRRKGQLDIYGFAYFATTEVNMKIAPHLEFRKYFKFKESFVQGDAQEIRQYFAWHISGIKAAFPTVNYKFI